MKLEAVPGDITKEYVDAVVNATVVQEDSGPIPAGIRTGSASIATNSHAWSLRCEQ